MTHAIVQKVWNFCSTLRDDGVGCGDYLEKLTYLIFLRMADEYACPPSAATWAFPPSCGWTNLRTPKRAALEVHYVDTLRRLGLKSGVLGQIVSWHWWTTPNG